MSESTRRVRRMLGVLLPGVFTTLLALMSAMVVRADSLPVSGNATMRGDAEAGRTVFNGKGVCYYCHGVDGYRDKLPQLAADTTAFIVRLSPQPADLRQSKHLRLTNDNARRKAIREGHPGTGMFPDSTMTEQELTDTLAYLARLRHEGSPRNP